MYIDWATKIIHVLRTDSFMTLVQNTPTVIYDLSLNNFRLGLKEIESSSEGIPFLRTHNHNTEVTLGGLTFARVIEIINGYTITFEDAQYAVNLVGANSNVGDNVNVNQVSVRSQNSAGMTSSPDIEYASFQNCVTVDINSPYDGTLYPVGTKREPVNNLDDALLIAEYRGFKKLFVESDLVIDEGDLTGFVIEGNNHIATSISVLSAAIVDNLKIVECTIENTTLDQNIEISNCLVQDISYVNGHIHDSGIKGTIVLGGNKDSVLANCYTVDQDTETVIDMNGSGNSLAAPNYSGIIRIKNLNDSEQEVGIGLSAGMVKLDADVTAGLVMIAGTGMIEDNSTGTTIVNIDGLINVSTIAQKTWEQDLDEILTTNSIGVLIKKLYKLAKNIFAVSS